MHTESQRVDATIGQTLTPFLIEHHRRTGADVATLVDVVAGDHGLIMLALVYAELPGVAEEAVQGIDAARAGGVFRRRRMRVAADNAAAQTAGQIRDRIALLVSGKTVDGLDRVCADGGHTLC